MSHLQMLLVKDASTISKQAAHEDSKPAEHQDDEPAEQQQGSAELRELEHRHANNQPSAVPDAEVGYCAYKQIVDESHSVISQQLQKLCT